MPVIQMLEKLNISYPISDLSMVVWCIYIGAVIGWAGVLFNKFVPGAVVRKILRKKLHQPESAQTVDEIGIAAPLRMFLRDGGTLRKIVKSTEQLADEQKAREDQGAAEERKPEKSKKRFLPFEREFRRPVKSQHFFIPEELRYRAENRYSSSIADILVLVIGAAGLLAVAVYLYNFGIPQIMNMVNGMIG